MLKHKQFSVCFLWDNIFFTFTLIFRMNLLPHVSLTILHSAAAAAVNLAGM